MKSNVISPRPTVAVFGGSRFINGTSEYQLAYDLGYLLANAGFQVINGGGPGAMEATAKGVKDGGGTTIGAIVHGADWALPNTYLDEIIECDDLFLRIREMYAMSCAFIALKGGTGTLAELALIWNLLSLEPENTRPLFLVGKNWQSTIDAIIGNLIITEGEKKVISIYEKPIQVVEGIKKLIMQA